MKIRSILGDIEASSLKYCQCHEHLFIASGLSEKLNPVLLIDDYEKTYIEVVEYYKNGGRSIVDAQPLGCGRMAQNLLKLSRETNVHIICSTGFHKLLFYDDNHWIHNITSEEFAKLMIEEIEHGLYIDGDESYPKKQIRYQAGMIKTAVDYQGIDPIYEKYFQAAAVASKKTGIPIQCHIENAKTADKVISFFQGYNIKTNQIILAHMDRNINYKKEAINALEKGVFLQCDTIARYKYHSDQDEINWLKSLCNAGFSKQLLIGLDTTRARLRAYGGEVGLSFILEKFIDNLLENGFDLKTIKELTVNNPQRALSIK